MSWIELKSDTVTAALQYPDSVSLVFASHKRPGGGYLRHERGQEEWIARRTDLVERLQPFKHMYGSNVKAFYILLKDIKFMESKEKRDLICVPAPLAPSKTRTPLYKDLDQELESRIKHMCELVKSYKVFIIGPWGCGFFGNKVETVKALFKKHATNETIVFVTK